MCHFGRQFDHLVWRTSVPVITARHLASALQIEKFKTEKSLAD